MTKQETKRMKMTTAAGVSRGKKGEVCLRTKCYRCGIGPTVVSAATTVVVAVDEGVKKICEGEMGPVGTYKPSQSSRFALIPVGDMAVIVKF